jgi:hypothetical protein
MPVDPLATGDKELAVFVDQFEDRAARALLPMQPAPARRDVVRPREPPQLGGVAEAGSCPSGTSSSSRAWPT